MITRAINTPPRATTRRGALRRILRYGPSTIPPRIRASLAYARYCAFSTRPPRAFTQPRELTRLESATHTAALDLLLDYLTGDIELEVERPPPHPQSESPAPPPQRGAGM